MPGPAKRVADALPPDARQALAVPHEQAATTDATKLTIVAGINQALDNRDLFGKKDFAEEDLPPAAKRLLKLKREDLSRSQVQLLNRLLLQTAFADEIVDYGGRREFTVNVITSVLIVLVLLYTVLGGMVSVIVTDYVQFVILSIGLGLGLYFCLSHPDLGWGAMVGALKTHRGEAAFNPVHPGSYGWLWVIWMFLHGGMGAVLWAPEASRMLTAKDPQTTTRTFFFASPGQFVRLAIPCLFAIAAFCFVAKVGGDLAAHFFPEGLGGKPENAAQAMPLLMGKIVPTGLLGLLVAGLMAAFMSTHDSYFLCWSSVITRDIVNPLRAKKLTDKEQIRLTRIIILCIGAFLLVWGVWYELPGSVWNYMAVTGSVYFCGAASVLIGGMYWKRASSAGALAAMLGGLISVPVIFLPEVLKNDTALMGRIGIANYAFCALIFIVFSLLFPEKPKPAAQEA